MSPGFQAAATKLSLGASIGLWLDFKSRRGLVNPSGPLCCRNAPGRTNQSPAGAVAPPPVALLGSGNQSYESVRGRQRAAIMRRSSRPRPAGRYLRHKQTHFHFLVPETHLCLVSCAAPSFPLLPEFRWIFSLVLSPNVSCCLTWCRCDSGVFNRNSLRCDTQAFSLKRFHRCCTLTWRLKHLETPPLLQPTHQQTQSGPTFEDNSTFRCTHVVFKDAHLSLKKTF